VLELGIGTAFDEVDVIPLPGKRRLMKIVRLPTTIAIEDSIRIRSA
jgi:hypothetical protein